VRKRPDWQTYFLNIAGAVSKRSTCLRRQYGAVIVRDNRILSTGYNGSAKGESNCVDCEYCLREDMEIPAGERYELCRAVHAEANAITLADFWQLKGADIYIVGFNADGTPASGKPCIMCARLIKQAGIKRVYRWENDQVVCDEW